MNSTLDWLQTKVANDDTDKLTEAELLGLILSDDKVACEVVEYFGGLKGMAYQPLEKLLRFKGLGEAKIIRIAACFEISRRIVQQVLEIERR